MIWTALLIMMMAGNKKLCSFLDNDGEPSQTEEVNLDLG